MVHPYVAAARRLAAISILLLATATSCRGRTETSVTDRLWVSSLPTRPKVPLNAFVTARTAGGRFLGAYVDGSMYRGSYDVFAWRNDSDRAATVTFLQDRRTVKLAFSPCEPSRGYHYCVMVTGDPAWARKYQSRKNWGVRRGPSGSVADLYLALDEIASADPELRAWLEPGPLD